MIGDLTTHLWQSTLFALAAGVLTLAFRNNRAKVRYGLWLSASLKFFVPFGWLVRLGSRLGWAPVAHGIAAPQVSFAMERIAQPFAEPLPLASPGPVPVNWTQIAIAGLWVCGCAAIALLRLRQWRQVRAAVRASTPLDIPAAVQVRSSPALLEPGVVGLFRPVLLLPEGIPERLTAAQLEAVLAHELWHVRRRDNLFSALHMVVEGIFWFHPLVWWIGARLVEERERACDEGVLSLGNEPRTYADAILTVCKLYVESPLVCVSGVTGANLKRRIEAILTNRTGEGLNRARKFLLAAAGMAALAGPVAIGVLIGVGHAPAIHAQSPAADPPAQTAHAALASPQDAPPAQAAATPTAADKLYQNRRLMALLFDLDTMTSDEQSRARQSATDFVHRMQPADLVALMAASQGGVSVVEDFTGDQAALASEIGKLSGGDGSSPGEAFRLTRLETAVRLLAPLSGKKALIYFSTGIEQAKAYEPAQLQEVIDAAVRANVAFYPMDANGVVSQPGPQVARPPAEPSAPAGLSQEEYDRRRAYAQANFGSASSAKGRTYIRYGPPDQIEDRGSAPDSPQIWRYNYLENFHSNVEFEFSKGNRANGVRINWPPPSATFTGTPGAGANGAAGLPGRHASMATYPAGEVQTLSVPLDSLTGEVDITARIQMLPTPGMGAGAGMRALVSVDSNPSGVYQANFLLQAGSYVCTLKVTEQATGQTYAETIDFEVK